ncbi:hypothetical protein A3A39_02100 [Candidatus Kaiserbacteria bacterium RIFCSPLOWO2_01_FULL_54_13]|uniref:Uncharacterized protein n=1 Tax=Candidatus Kaiserbacteria bacterium RIFCSPLOWO2_01_FULL_54_13 TaxID=1798512 RepID=A0A1F6F175_9BACT|nr:MAG: hypothetical protein A3A39_02100 [Candidatus Kaiserbacteria bacterium RIFCSPLOWO2_01_FULL_54_13]
MWLATSAFLFSLAGIVGLFALKEWETRHNRNMAPKLRERADAWAIRLKELLLALQVDAEKLPPEILHVSRIAIHEAALLSAAFLRFLALQAHKLADFVSHKRSFQRRAPRSEFLKKVLEHKNGGGERSE